MRVGLFGETSWLHPTWMRTSSEPALTRVRCRQGYSRSPTAPRVSLCEHVNLEPSDGHAKTVGPPGSVMSRSRDGVSVVVRVRESRAHGEAGQ
jgi:hypothetical protein